MILRVYNVHKKIQAKRYLTVIKDGLSKDISPLLTVILDLLMRLGQKYFFCQQRRVNNIFIQYVQNL